MLELIHMTATYSNAVLVAMLPHFSDFSKTLDLPVPQPLTTNCVASSVISKIKDDMEGSVVLTNGYWFPFDSIGYASSFRSTNNIFFELDPSKQEDVARYVGKVNMTTNQAVNLARETIKKLGYKLEYFGAQGAPTYFEGPINSKQGVLPFCSIRWELPEDEQNRFEVQVDMQTKTLVGLCFGFGREFARTNHIGTPLKVDVVPELESDYQKRTSGKILIRSNAPPPPRPSGAKTLE